MEGVSVGEKSCYRMGTSKKRQAGRGRKTFKGLVKKQPENNLAKWTLNAYNGDDFKLPDETPTDENYRVLQRWITILNEAIILLDVF
jgi:hypothetical protein